MCARFATSAGGLGGERSLGALEHYLGTVHGRIAVHEDDEPVFRELAFRKHYVGAADRVHVSLQLPVGRVEAAGTELRPDLYLWIAGVLGAGVIVECGGFHQRAVSGSGLKPLALPGSFRVLRLAGVEVFRDPVGAALKILNAADAEFRGAAMRRGTPAREETVAPRCPDRVAFGRMTCSPDGVVRQRRRPTFAHPCRVFRCQRFYGSQRRRVPATRVV